MRLIADNLEYADRPIAKSCEIQRIVQPAAADQGQRNPGRGFLDRETEFVVDLQLLRFERLECDALQPRRLAPDQMREDVVEAIDPSTLAANRLDQPLEGNVPPADGLGQPGPVGGGSPDKSARNGSGIMNRPIACSSASVHRFA